MKVGAICYLDEIVEARKDTTVLIHPLTDYRRLLPVDKRGELLEAADGFLLVMSYNPGYQSALKDLKHSTRQRFVAIEFGYPPRDQEAEIIQVEGGCPPDIARELAKLGEKVAQPEGARTGGGGIHPPADLRRPLDRQRDRTPARLPDRHRLGAHRRRGGPALDRGGRDLHLRVVGGARPSRVAARPARPAMHALSNRGDENELQRSNGPQSMSPAEELATRYAAELRGFGASLPDNFSEAAHALQDRLSEDELQRWAETGIALATHSLRSWEAAAEYFRASPRLIPALSFGQLMGWALVATELAERSSMVAAAFLKATPETLGRLEPATLEPWARQGERLCRGNWKSVALSSLFFSSSPKLLESLSLEHLDQLVDVIDALTERSYELATTCLEGAGTIFGQLERADREPFLAFARAVTRASWADTRLYFERGPALLEEIDPAQRGVFLELAARVTTEVGRQGFPLFADAAASLGETGRADHAPLLDFASRLAAASPIAAMEYLKSAPFVRSRLTPAQMERWSDFGASVLFDDANAEGAEAFFRLESARAEEMLSELSARVELPRVGGTLRLYSKALTGEQISVRSTEDLVERGIGWVTESTATTEGTSIYLPPFVNTFEEKESNFQVYKVFATHQAGRIEFGSFKFRFGVDGVHTPSTVEQREGVRDGDAAGTATPMERFYDLFAERVLISGLFTVVEDTRVDAFVAREYSGIRSSLRRLQAFEAGRRPDVRGMGLRQAFVENLVRASLDRPETILWPASLQPLMRDALAALKVVEQPDASVQDSAEVAAALYDLAERIPNIPDALPGEQWEPLSEEMFAIEPGMPGAGEGQGQLLPHGEEIEFETPPQPEFRGDFKPELVQLLMKLKLQQEGDPGGVLSPITEQQLQELLDKSVEITLSEWAEGDLASSLGMFLSDLEKDAATPASDAAGQKSEGTGGESDPEPESGELPVEIEWHYYDEWDFRAVDYRPRWCRVGERPRAEGELDYYEETLSRHHGLVLETRRQFELLRPESFRKIKRLEDGDDIDIDRAIEFLIDKRAGVGPLARVYSRRNKIERDVAVAFLLDMSASTDEEIEKQRQRRDEAEQDDDFDDDPRKYFQWLAERRAKQSIEPPSASSTSRRSRRC